MPFKKGKSGNPKGRPKKGKALTDILIDVGAGKIKYIGGTKVERKEALAMVLWDKALNGDVNAAKYIYDRIDGKPIEKLQHFGSVVASSKRELTPKEREQYEKNLAEFFPDLKR